MTTQARSPLWGILRAPFTRRAWAELAYAIVSAALTLGALAFIVPMLANGALWALSAPGARKLGGAGRFLARTMIGEDVPSPAPMRPRSYASVRTPNPEGLAAGARAEGARARVSGSRVRIIGLPASRIAELTAGDSVAIRAVRPESKWAWMREAVYDPAAWRARLYFGLKLPLAAIDLLVAVGLRLVGLAYLTYPVWWQFAKAGPSLPGGVHTANQAGAVLLLPVGAVLLLAAPWLTQAVTDADRQLIRGLLGPGSADAAALAERVRNLEVTRAHAVEDSAARLRRIERDLHDGAQAQLVALAMKLGLAKEKLLDTAPPDLSRVAQLVDDAHRSAIAAIAELRTLARGIHPSVLDNGLVDALTTLAERSAVPVELVTDIPERPSDAIETIAYFSAAELLANVGKHSGARHATLEAVHVPGLLRIRVTDDGHGGASLVPDGGLSGLAERVRTVDGRLDVDSPRGGPTVVTVELPSHA
jgi:signal transduction histidine kinase